MYCDLGLKRIPEEDEMKTAKGQKLKPYLPSNVPMPKSYTADQAKTRDAAFTKNWQ
jgi:hypothetical protein